MFYKYSKSLKGLFQFAHVFCNVCGTSSKYGFVQQLRFGDFAFEIGATGSLIRFVKYVCNFFSGGQKEKEFLLDWYLCIPLYFFQKRSIVWKTGQHVFQSQSYPKIDAITVTIKRQWNYVLLFVVAQLSNENFEMAVLYFNLKGANHTCQVKNYFLLFLDKQIVM